MPETSIPPPEVISRPAKPVSEALLNEKVRVYPMPKLPSCSTPLSGHILRISMSLTDRVLLMQWDRCLSSLLIRSSLGLSFGVVFSVLLFKRRAWPAFVGLGFGAGRAYEECNGSFLRTNTKEGVRVVRP
jgi:inner membrane organizing system protein 1